MIAKIVKGSNFKGVVNYILDKEKDAVNYILDKEKDAKILVCDGLFAENKETIAGSFEAQARTNPKVTKPVGHISLAFHKEDEHRLTDRAMAGLALEYLKEMEINNTQILIVRHFDKEHPHVHVAFNRIANDGRTISDRNERIRSTRVCKELTWKYGLYFADGKEQVKRHRLKEPDKTKYELYSILKTEVSRCGNWNILIANLKKQGVDVRFKYEGKSDYRHRASPPLQFEPKGSDDLYSGSIGLFMPDNSNTQADENYFEEQLKRKNKKKKQRKIRF